MFVDILYTARDILPTELEADEWGRTTNLLIAKYWSGDEAPRTRHASAQLLWSDAALHVRFLAAQHEPLIVAPEPVLSRKTLGLWDRDVCEIFIAPDRSRRYSYFEFEAAPTGEWVDLAIELRAQSRETDVEFASGMTTTSRVEPAQIVTSMRIPWEAFGSRPSKGDIWLGNLFRCVGAGETRGYLSWLPTRTPRPNFHVPEAFGDLRFVDQLPSADAC